MIITTKKKKKKDEDIAPVKTQVFSDETKQAVKDTAKSTIKNAVNNTGLGKVKNIWDNGYQIGDVTNTILNMGNLLDPKSMFTNKVENTVQQTVNTIKQADGGFVKKSKAFDDGYDFGDVSKTILGTTGDVVANLAKGELQTAEGLVDTGRYVVSDVAKFAGADKYSKNVKERATQNTTGFILGENDLYNKPIENGWSKKLDEYSVFDNKMDQIVQSVGQQGFRVGLQGALGMTGASEGTIEALNKLEIFAGSYGTAKSEALMNGASDKDATIRGAISGTAEYISENLFDSLPGFKTGEAKGISKIKSIIGESAEKTFGKGTGKAILRVFGAAGEGFEEILSNGLETAGTDIVNLIDSGYSYGMKEGQGLTEDGFVENAAKLFEDVYGSAVSKESGEAFVSAFFSTLITGAISDGMSEVDRQNVIKGYAEDNNISVEKATQLFDGIRDLRTQQILDNNATYEQRTNTEDQLTKQLTQEIRNNKDLNLQELQEGLIARDKFTQAVGTGVVSSKGLDLVESYKAYNGDAKYNNEINNIQKFMNNRNIDARFDATMFDNNEQNAIWTTENGQDSVVFNPNASADQVIQNIATHEMTHDIINQKTEAGTSLFNDVLENIKSQQNYAEQRKEIEDLYAKYYDRNSEDFAAKVDEEMVANELGKNLGTQEYINRLVNEKPNLARRIYNWVVDKLDNIGKSAEYKEQKAYWKSVADKFEVAYNEQKTATGEDKTAYSMGKHYGDLGKGNDTYYGHMYDSRRSTGHFGTGTYFVNENYQPGENSSYANRPSQKVEFDNYDNLYKPSTRDEGFDLHDGLKEINYNNTPISKDLYDKLLPYYEASFNAYNEVLDEDYNNDYKNVRKLLEEAGVETEEPNSYYESGKGQFGNTYEKYLEDKITDVLNNYDRYQKAERDLKRILNLSDEQFNEAIEKVRQTEKEYESHSYEQKLKDDSLSTIFMKTLGYNGVDVRGLEGLDNTQYGSVIYDLDNKKTTTKYSLTSNKDSEGRTLSKEQQEYFKDSKAVDDDGNLLTLYHNTDYDFTEFDANKFGANTDEKLRGIYLSPEPLGSYGDRSIEAYANITNPVTIESNNITYDQFKELLKGKINDNNIESGWRYLKNSNDIKKLEQILNQYKRNKNYQNPQEFYDNVKAITGYDGVIYSGNEAYANNRVSYVAFNSNQVKNVDNKAPTTNPDIRYSLTKDNTGRELSEGQKEYFKDSKVRDDDGNLVTVYHTTTDKGAQYNTFNPVGTEGYKFGDNEVNFFSNSAEMSGSYADFEYETVDTRKLNNIKDARNWLDKIVKENSNLEYKLNEIDNDNYRLELYDKTDKAEKGLYKLVGNYTEENLLRNIQEQVNEHLGNIAKYQYEGYLNITNPYIFDAEESNWDELKFKPKPKDIQKVQNMDSSIKEKLLNEYNKINTEYKANNNKYFELLNKQAEIRNNNWYTYKTDSKYLQLQKQIEEFTADHEQFNEKYSNIFDKADYVQDQFTKNTKDLYNQLKKDGYKFSEEALYNIVHSNFDNTAIKNNLEKNFETNDIVKEVLKMNEKGANYDGVIIKNVADWYTENEMMGNYYNDIYATFNSNQFKAVDNLNPTEDADIRYSMQQDVAPFTQGTRTTYGELFDRNIAPIREDLSKLTEQMENVSKQLETLQEQAESTSKGYVETYNEQRNENIPTRSLTEEDANTLQDALMNDEGYLRSLDEQANTLEDNSKLIDRLTNYVNDKFDLNRDQKQRLRDIVKDAVDNNLSSDEIARKLAREFSELSYDMDFQEAIEAKKLIKSMPINVTDNVKADIADYGDFKRRNFNKIIFSKNGGYVDTIYAELSNQMPYYFPSDIINPSDQLQKIAEVANMSNKVTETIDVDPEEFDNIADYIRNTTLQDEYNAQMKAQDDLDTDIRMNLLDDIAPTTIRTQESIDDYIENRDIAPVKQDKAKLKVQNKEKANKMFRQLQEMFVNRNYVIDQAAKATGNNEIKFAGDNLNNVSGEVQFNINNSQTDINGNWIGEGLNQIFAPIEQAGDAQAFNDYLFQRSNIERHNVGKGSQVPLAVSEQLVRQYDIEHPEFRENAEKVYKFIDNYTKEEVQAGLISQETYDNYRGEYGIYGSYTPFYANEIDTSRYYDDEGKVKPVSTFKKSKGGASDVSELMTMKDAIAKQVYAEKRAVRQNELYREIVTSLDKYNEAMDMDTRNEITNLDDSLYMTPDGDYILSAYVNGEKISAKINEELYNELTRTNEQRVRQLEEDFSLITKPLQKISGVRRNLLTTWNPTFLTRNLIKDIQDSIINSKHTADMLGNYFGTKENAKPAAIELAQAKTKEAQQFLALYGADNLYGDYSNLSNSKKFTNKLLRLNELIELAPRYAEFKASLQNGESVNEAMYNAREVTTNFGRGGYITKAMNRNGFTFLNANVQGLDKVIRNLSGENGVKGVTSVVAKGALFAVLPSILNHLLYGTGDDKDEDYEALPDYIKDNYYLVKLENGEFVRIPKGRINSVFGSAARRTIEAAEGEENAFEGWGKNAWSQIGVGDAGGLQTIFTPIQQAVNNEAWYGGDIVPTRLQNKPAAEQTDASIDAISNFIGETFNISPYKVNYVLDQYSGGFGDVLLPMITPETASGAEGIEYLTAPIKDAFIVNSVDDNKYAGEFYDLKDKLEIQSNSQYATDEDKVKYKYMSGISKQMSDLYKERREVQADTTLSNKEKYAKVQAIQNEINALAKEGLGSYKGVEITDGYSNVGDTEYYKDADGEWTKVKDGDSEFTAGLSSAEKDSYYKVKNKISGFTEDYKNKIKDLDKDSPLRQQYASERKENITQAIIHSGLDNQTKAMVYAKYYSNEDTMTNVVNAGYNTDTYITALYDIGALREKYSKENGYTTEQRKAKTIAYINSLDMNIPQKAMLIRNYYSSYRAYNKDIVSYVSSLNLTYEERKAILEDAGMTVNGNNVSWK